MLLALLLLATGPVSTVRLEESGNAKIGSAAPSFGGWDLAQRRVLTLDGMRRTPFLQPLLLTFGASWCKPCTEGLPRLKAFTDKHPEVRLVLVAVENDAEQAQKLAARVKLDGPSVLDKFEQIAKLYGVAGEEKMQLPRTFLIDAAGKIRAIYSAEGDDFEKVIAADLEAARALARPALEQ
jgi:peroxiredoxin